MEHCSACEFSLYDNVPGAHHIACSKRKGKGNNMNLGEKLKSDPMQFKDVRIMGFDNKRDAARVMTHLAGRYGGKKCFSIVQEKITKHAPWQKDRTIPVLMFSELEYAKRHPDYICLPDMSEIFGFCKGVLAT